MSQLTYSVYGNTVTLDIARINPGTRYAAVYDPTETDRLYTHHYIDVNCVFNPLATAAAVNGVGAHPPYIPNPRDVNLNLPIAAGTDPITSLAGLHQFLMTPRGQLTVTNGGITLFYSPRNETILNQAGVRAGPSVDAKNGPRPVSCEIVAVHGSKSAIVRYVIETWLEEVDPFFTSMLSHRWTAQHNVDVDNFMLTTKHVEGLVIFRGDELSLLGDFQKIDDFRVRFGHPIPDGVMRKNIMVKAEADGLQIRYSFDDEEQVTNLYANAGIVKVEASIDADFDWTNPGFGIPIFGLGGNVLPTFHQGAMVSLWGKRSITRNQLAKAAVNVLASFGGVNIKAPFFKYGIHMDMVNRYCEAHMMQLASGYGPIGGIVGLLGAPSLNDIAAHDWPENIGDLGNTAIRPNIAPPGSGGTRGTFPERLVTQALGTAGTAPLNPQPAGAPQDIN